VDEDFRFILEDINNAVKTNLKKIVQEKNKTKSVQEIIKKYESKLNGSIVQGE